jgi:hypothetical protein
VVSRHRHRHEQSPEEEDDDGDRDPKALHGSAILARGPARAFPASVSDGFLVQGLAAVSLGRRLLKTLTAFGEVIFASRAGVTGAPRPAPMLA